MNGVAVRVSREARLAAGAAICAGCILKVRYVVEVRAGRLFRDGAWTDSWAQDGEPFVDQAEAGRLADVVRREGWAVRVRPIIV